MTPLADGPARFGFDVVSALATDARTLWRHATSPAGVNAELAPLLRMTFPPDVADLAAVPDPVGRVLFRSRILLFGAIPVEWDDLRFAALEPGRRFLERSTLLTQREWQHERVITTDGAGARLTDRLRFVPRVAALGPFSWAAFRAVFAWRHRRLRGRFGGRPLGFALETPRLVVRPWTAADRPALARLATDPEVIRWIADGRPWADVEIAAFLDRQRRLLRARGICLGAVVERTTGEIVGLGGLQPLGTTDDVEVGWWLAPSRWGRGYATEMGEAAIRFAFDVAGLERVVAVARPENARSIRVMERLGLRPLGRTTGGDLGLRVAHVEVVQYDRARDAGAAGGFTCAPDSE